MKYLSIFAFFTLAGCSGVRPNDIGVIQGRLTACPDSPNCVSSYATDTEHQILPLDATLAEIKQIVLSKPRVRIVTEEENYFYAEFTSKLMRFIDDVEFYYDPIDQVSHVRSASRLGKSDLGINRKRIEEIRSELNSN